MIEVLFASMILMTFIMTIVPIASLLKQEKEVLSERRLIANHLHDELQNYLWSEKNSSDRYSDVVDKTAVDLRFAKENDFIKGCVDWTNARQRKETFCLYGYPE